MLHSNNYNKLLNDKYINEFFKIKDETNAKIMEENISKCKSRNKILIITGHTLQNSQVDPANFANDKYFIDIASDKNYKQYMDRTYSNICTNCDKLAARVGWTTDKVKHLIKTESNVYKLDLILIHKYKIRPSPPYMGFIHNISSMRTNATKNNYQILTADNIYNDIIKNYDS